jgi:hypothetical protein
MAVTLVLPLLFIAWELGRIANILARMDRREHYKAEDR